jgi:O-antigen/teichoic acid export membrane protein
MIAGAIFLFQNIVAVVIAYLLSHAVLNLVVFSRISREIRGEPDQYDNGLINYGKHLTATGILVKIAKSLDHLLIVYFLGFQEVAVFAIAQVVPSAVKGSFKQLSSLTLPKFTATKPADMYKKLRLKLLQLLAIGGVTTGALMLVLPFLIPAVYSAKYAHSVLPAEILAISVLLSPLRNVLISALTSHRRIKELYYLRSVIPLFRIALLALLIPILGVTGAALSILLPRLTGTVYAWHAVKKMAREEQPVIM